MIPFQVEKIFPIQMVKHSSYEISEETFKVHFTFTFVHSHFETYVNYDVLKVSTDIPNDKSY